MPHKIKHPGLIKILELSPGHDGKITAVFSKGCLWWSSFPEDTSTSESGLTCCPFCGCTELCDMPLVEFLGIAEQAYDSDSLKAFISAHHRSARTCRTRWSRYKVKIKD